MSDWSSDVCSSDLLRLGSHDAALFGRRRVAETQCHKTLARAGLHAFEQILVARIVRNDQHEPRPRLQRFAGPFDIQTSDKRRVAKECVSLGRSGCATNT